jgi:hypothetical protein
LRASSSASASERARGRSRAVSSVMSVGHSPAGREGGRSEKG